MTARRLAAEAIGTGLLLVAVVGSGIVASGAATVPDQLFQHAVVVGIALVALIHTFGHVSGAHFNPAVTLVDMAFGGLSRDLAAKYVAVQVGGAIAGVALANVLFDQPVLAVATKQRTGAVLAASEALATFGLLVVIFGVVRSGRIGAVPGAVGAYIGGAIYFTSSTSLANPAVTVARSLTDTWTGVAPGGVPAFVVAQVVGAGLAWALIRWLFHPDVADAEQVVVPHPGDSDTAVPVVD